MYIDNKPRRLKLIRAAGLALVLTGLFPIVSNAQTLHKMNEVKVKKLAVAAIEAEEVSSLLDKEAIPYEPIQAVNWNKFPYLPGVKFRMAYSDSVIYLNFKVNEKSVRARYGTDNGKVWTDSCVEFFSIPGQDGVYYNLECNCIGTILLGAGSKRNNREHAGPAVTEKIKRWSSLGREPFEERLGDIEWEVSLIIPYSVFFKHNITTFQGKTIRANFYKCGDELSTPHYVSWNPIAIEKPDFHRPDFFGTLIFD